MMQTVPPQPHGMRVPILGQQKPSPEQMRMQIMQAMSALSMGIYTQLASAYITHIDEHQEFDEEHLRETAKRCQLAAQAYFEGLGIIEVKQG